MSVDEETGPLKEKLYWDHAFHEKRFDQANVLPPFDGDVLDALMGMVTIHEGALWVLASAGGGVCVMY